MKTVLLSVAMMVAAIALALWSVSEVEQLCHDMCDLISNAQQDAKNGDMVSAIDRIEKAEELYSDKNTLLTLIHKNTQVREITAALSKAKSCAEIGDINGMLENTAHATELIEALADTDRVTIGNVL